jgi:hypothetical protein
MGTAAFDVAWLKSSFTHLCYLELARLLVAGLVSMKIAVLNVSLPVPLRELQYLLCPSEKIQSAILPAGNKLSSISGKCSIMTCTEKNDYEPVRVQSCYRLRVGAG